MTDAETGRTYTFSGLKHASHEFGKGLKARWGWKKGDVLALYTPNSIDSAVVTLGAIWAGGIVSPANPLYTVDELAFQLKDSNAKGLVTQRPFLEAARNAAKSAGIPENRIILIGDRRDETGKFRHFCSIRSTSYTGWYAKARIDPKKDLALLVYSSGTTGIPKGVCLSHYNIVANLVQYSYMDGRHYLPFGGIDGKGDKQLGAIPLFHIYVSHSGPSLSRYSGILLNFFVQGLVCCVLGPIFFGWQVVLMEKFDLEKALQTIQNYGLTFMYIPPPIVLAFGKHPLVDKYDLSTLKVLHSAAAPLTRELTEAVWERLKIPVKQGFGLSETSPICHIQSPDEWAKYIGSVGKLVPNMEAQIVDEDGNEVAEGEPGELWLKGPNVFQGYLNNPERTREAFSPCGYFKTGDIFSRDKWGNYYCVDRLKELIKYSSSSPFASFIHTPAPELTTSPLEGFPVPPAELEGLLITHKDVADVCVIGVDDKELATEVPRAYVVLSQGVEASEEKAKELAEWMAKKVAPHKKLRGGIRFVDQVPKSPSGKILRRILRDQVRKEERAAGPKL